MYVLSVQYSCVVVSVILLWWPSQFSTVHTLLLYSLDPYGRTDRQTDRQRNEYTCFAWAGETFFPVVLLCRVSFWFWLGIGFGLHTHVLRVQYSCGVVLVFWLRREIVFGVRYILSVKYICVPPKQSTGK
jgi:hypothetical protein